MHSLSKEQLKGIERLKAYMERHYGAEGDETTYIRDGITDLLHIATMRGLDAKDELRIAVDNYEAEMYEETMEVVDNA